MSSKLERAMRSIERIVDLVDDVSLICGGAALKNFYRVSTKAKQLVENCCSVHWCQASASRILNEEEIKEILLETSLYYNTICEVEPMWVRFPIVVIHDSGGKLCRCYSPSSSTWWEEVFPGYSCKMLLC